MSKPRQNLLVIWGLLTFAWVAYGVSQPRYRFPDDGWLATFIVLPPVFMLMIGWALSRLWEKYGETYWLRLSLHLRRGLLRLYIVVSVPWIAYFGYRFLDALWHPYQHHTSEAFWFLVIVPVGFPIATIAALWVIAGFRERGQTARHQSKRQQQFANALGASSF